MRKSLALAALALTALAVSSMASAITIDGNWNDWFSSSLSAPSAAWWYNGGTGSAPASESSAIVGHDQLLPTSVIANAGYALDYENHMTSGLVAAFGEVYGGAEDYQDGVGNTTNTQAYDIEAVMALVQMDISGNATLNLGIISGMTQNGQWVYDGYVYPGDVFVNFDGSVASYDRAVRIGTDPRSGQMNGGGVGTLFGQAMGTNNPDTFTSSRPYRVASTSAPTGVAQVAWDTPANGYGSHHFVEMSFGLTSAELASLRLNGIDVHWTVSCGNDVFNPSFRVLPRPPVPEPSTLALLGMGLIGAAMRRKLRA